MAINTIQYLVSPRIIAGVISLPLLTSIFNDAGIYGGYLVGSLATSYQNEFFRTQLPQWLRDFVYDEEVHD